MRTEDAEDAVLDTPLLVHLFLCSHVVIRQGREERGDRCRLLSGFFCPLTAFPAAFTVMSRSFANTSFEVSAGTFVYPDIDDYCQPLVPRQDTAPYYRPLLSPRTFANRLPLVVPDSGSCINESKDATKVDLPIQGSSQASKISGSFAAGGSECGPFDSSRERSVLKQVISATEETSANHSGISVYVQMNGWARVLFILCDTVADDNDAQGKIFRMFLCSWQEPGA